MWTILEETLTRIGRTLEYWVTGQSSFRLSSGDLTAARTVDNETQARLMLQEVQREMKSEFNLSLRWPILLDLKRPPAHGWKSRVYNPEGNLGRYQPADLGSKPGHQVQVRPGLPRPRFRAVLAHELVHAYQREADILKTNPALREGMARWVEYHFLLRPLPREARRLRRLRLHTFGKSIETLLDYEQRHGIPATVRWLHAAQGP